jgi:NADPH2:quinone reductase
VIAVAQGGEKAKLLRQMGADFVVDTAQTPDLRKEVQEFLKERGAKGVDVVLDPVGGKQFKEALRVVKWGAQIIVIGFASGEVPSIPANIVMVKNITVHGLYWGSHMQHDPKVLLDSMKELMGWFRDGSISVQVSHKFPLEEGHKAFAALMRREARGKVLVVPGGVQEGVKGSGAEKVEAPVLGWAGGGSMTSKL